jgi:hypothetical protein
MTLWIHKASSTFRRDEPVNLIQTVWIADAGWGSHKTRDQWIATEQAAEELQAAGYTELAPPEDPDVVVCPHCMTYMQGVPGSVVQKHLQACGGSGDNWIAMEAAVIADYRLKKFEAQIEAETKRAKEEQAAQEKKERFDRMREDIQKQQTAKDRKRKIREETRRDLRKK